MDRVEIDKVVGVTAAAPISGSRGQRAEVMDCVLPCVLENGMKIEKGNTRGRYIHSCAIPEDENAPAVIQKLFLLDS